jgi:hypothetical protein
VTCEVFETLCRQSGTRPVGIFFVDFVVFEVRTSCLRCFTGTLSPNLVAKLIVDPSINLSREKIVEQKKKKNLDF